MNRNSQGVYLLAKTIQFFLTPVAKLKYGNKKIWIVSERGHDARDNGYHMFVYLRKHHPEINAWYLISEDSPDLSKISDLGNIVYKRSLKYFMMFISASVFVGAFVPFIPSGNKKFGLDVKKKKNQKYVFLQHGVIDKFLPVYHKDKAHFDLFFCGAKPEYDYVCEHFGYKDGEVRYTGLARFDALHDIKTKRTVLIMPTWRTWLANLDSKEVAQSEYVKRWNSIINNPELVSMAEQYNVNFIFYPHELMQKYVDLFVSPNKNIIIGNRNEYDVQTLLKECSLLVTDYSSVHFDFAYMKKPLIYYQFDGDQFFRDHAGIGWMDHEKNGFGDCVYDEDDLIKCIGFYVKNEFEMKPEFEEHIKDVFPLHDDRNCERIYQEIVKTFDHDELF